MNQVGETRELMNNHLPIDAPATAEKITPGIAEELRSLRLGDAERRRQVRPGRRRRLGRWLLLVLVIAAGGGGGGWWWWTSRTSGDVVDAVLFSTETKTETLLDKTGYIVPHNRIKISPEVGGIITKIYIDVNDVVKKGMVLIELDDARYKAEWEQNRAALAAAEAQLEELKAGARPEEIQEARATLQQTQARIVFLREEVKRIYNSRIGFAASQAEYEKAVGSLREAEATERSQKAHLKLVELGPRKEKILVAEAEVHRARANLDKARFYYERTHIKSPCDGTVLKKDVEIGEAVHPEVLVGTMLELADLSDLEAEAEIPERDLALLEDVAECQVIPDAFPNKTYRAKLSRVEPLVNRQRGVVKVKVKILNPDKTLKADMNCRILFPRKGTSSNPDLPILTEEAILHEGKEIVVYVLDGMAARRRVIECGRTIGNSIEIRSGLKQGDVVLLPGAKPLRDGESVLPRFKK